MQAVLSGTGEGRLEDASSLPAKRVLLLLAKGFEDAEAACAMDVLGWTHYRPHAATVNVETAGMHPRVTGAFGSSYDVDVALDDVRPNRYDALVIPGGFHNLGYDEIYDHRVHALVNAMRECEKPIATMCVGVLPVAEAGALNGGNATTYALSSRHDNLGRLRALGCVPTEEAFTEWAGIISCSGPAHCERVMYRLLELLVGTDVAAEVARYRDGCK